MCKKITLVIAAVVLLIGVQSLIAQERDVDRPRGDELLAPARPVERQPIVPDQEERPERSRIQQRDRERTERGDQPLPEPPMVMENRRQPAPPMAPTKTGPVQEDFGKWLDELTKAYRANDREKMGEIIRQMQQLRQQRQAPGKIFAEPPRDYPQGPKVKKFSPGPEKKASEPAKKRPEPTKKPPQAWKDQQGGFPGGPAGWGVCPWCGRCPRCGAMAGQGMAFQQRGFGRFRPEGPPPVMDKQAPPMAPKDIPGPEPLRMRRGMGGWRPDLPGPDVPQPRPVEPRQN